MTSIASRSALYQLIVALCSIQSAIAAPSVWSVNIDESPAPAPDKGPPLSADAIRNSAYLPYDLVAIFGAYLVAVIAVGAGIVSIGRRRRALQSSPRSLGMDMMKPGGGLTGEGRTAHKPKSEKHLDPSPLSPTKFWASPNLKHGWENITGRSSKKTSIANVSIVTADESVIEEDRRHNEFELDRLYAAVAEHEANKQTGVEFDQHSRQQNPPELQHLRLGMHPFSGHGPAEMVETFPSRVSTTSPRAATASPPQRTLSGNSGRRVVKKGPPTALSLHSTAHSSRTSLNSTTPHSARHPISPPMGAPGMAPDHGDIYSDIEPLTPRLYAPGPPPVPPTPTNAASYVHERETQRHREVLTSPTLPGDVVSPARSHFAPSIRSSRSTNVGLPASPRSPRQPMSSRQATFPRITERPSKEGGFQPGHTRGKSSGGQSTASRESVIHPGFDFSLSPAPGRSGKNSPTESTHTAASKRSRRPPAQLTINLESTNGSTHALASAEPLSSISNNGSGLPFRTAALPLRDLRSPTSQGPSTIKATLLDRPARRAAPGGLLRAPNTAGLAGPATPYSPYMPQTPMTPMTPSRLVTREERKRREREERKRIITHEDVVQEEEEMWE